MTALGIGFLVAALFVNVIFYLAEVRRNLWYVLMWFVTSLYLALDIPFLLNISAGATAMAILAYTILIIVFWFVRIPTGHSD